MGSKSAKLRHSVLPGLSTAAVDDPIELDGGKKIDTMPIPSNPRNRKLAEPTLGFGAWNIQEPYSPPKNIKPQSTPRNNFSFQFQAVKEGKDAFQRKGRRRPFSTWVVPIQAPLSAL